MIQIFDGQTAIDKFLNPDYIVTLEVRHLYAGHNQFHADCKRDWAVWARLPLGDYVQISESTHDKDQAMVQLKLWNDWMEER